MKTSFIISNLRTYSAIIAMAASFLSCIPQKNLKYLQEQSDDLKKYSIQPYERNVIKPNDELYITVSSFDDINFNYFQSTAQTAYNQGSTEMGLSLISYAVKDNGTIYFPILGDLEVAGLTLNQATERLAELLKPYFNQPTVIVRFTYKKVTVLGEVNMPGYHTYSKEQLNVFEALGLAGDLTVHGNRREIYLLRNRGNQEVEKIRLDITSDAIITSDHYFLKADDILYVAPRTSVSWSAIPTQLTLVFSGITAMILILNYFNQ